VAERILLVDDEPAFRYAAAKILTDAGYDVVSTANYLGALSEIGDDSRVKLMLTDVVMPGGMNGFALARMAQHRQRDLKVLFMTAFDVPTDEAIGPVLHKPLEPTDLLNHVKGALAA